MSAITKISKRAKQISRLHKNKSWKECIAAASNEYRAGKLGVTSYRQTGKSNKARDKKIKAKPPGKRIVKHPDGKTTVYYERRKNRSDRPGSLTGYRVGSMFEYFDVNGISNIDDLKQQYFKNAKRYHPDAGGRKEDFQKMQNEYENLLKRVLSGSELNAEEVKSELELDEAIRNAANAVVSLPGINIELTGKWIWVSGNTYPVRNELKAAGFQWAPVKQMWYYKGIESAGRGNLSIDDIRAKYGTKDLKTDMKRLNGIGLTLSTARRKRFYAAIKKAAKAINNRTNKKVSVSGIIKKVY